MTKVVRVVRGFPEKSPGFCRKLFVEKNAPYARAHIRIIFENPGPPGPPQATPWKYIRSETGQGGPTPDL